jgi:uncharacterized RmlC-like cupin family protein
MAALPPLRRIGPDGLSSEAAQTPGMKRQEVGLRAAPGHDVFVSSHVPHVEENPNDEGAVVLIARSTQEAIVENLDAL